VRVELPLPDENENEDPKERDPTINLRKMHIKTISAGGRHSLVLTVDGFLYAFGYG